MAHIFYSFASMKMKNFFNEFASHLLYATSLYSGENIGGSIIKAVFQNRQIQDCLIEIALDLYSSSIQGLLVQLLSTAKSEFRRKETK